jgi:hypothetical protein
MIELAEGLGLRVERQVPGESTLRAVRRLN